MFRLLIAGLIVSVPAAASQAPAPATKEERCADLMNLYYDSIGREIEAETPRPPQTVTEKNRAARHGLV